MSRLSGEGFGGGDDDCHDPSYFCGFLSKSVSIIYLMP